MDKHLGHKVPGFPLLSHHDLDFTGCGNEFLPAIQQAVLQWRLSLSDSVLTLSTCRRRCQDPQVDGANPEIVLEFLSGQLHIGPNLTSFSYSIHLLEELTGLQGGGCILVHGFRGFSPWLTDCTVSGPCVWINPTFTSQQPFEW